MLSLEPDFIKNHVLNFVHMQNVHEAEAYLGPCQTSKIELFSDKLYEKFLRTIVSSNAIFKHQL